MFLIPERTRSVLVFAGFVGFLILLSAYCTDRDGSIDELGFQNPPYMLAHFGKLTFPAYSHNAFFDLPVITHPSLHLEWIGLLWRMGFSMYYAEATPTVLLFLLAILVIVSSGFPAPVKLGWLFSIGFLATTGEQLTLCFGVRPEGELLAAWLCGLLLLESGRLADWNRFRLFAGAFFLTWASGVHYYAFAAFTGVVFYGLWAWRDLGHREARSRILSLCAGGCIVGLPYLALYLLPHFKAIYAIIRLNQGFGGVGLSISKHLELYRQWSHDISRPWLIRKAMAPGIPLMVFSTAILLAMRSTRGIGLAALPLQLGLFFFASHKMPFYLVDESVLFAAAVAILLLASANYLVTRFLPRFARAFAPSAAALLSLALVFGSPMLANARVIFQPRVHELEVAHAAGRRILGPHARVGGRWMAWYSTGAEHWYDIEHDLLSDFLLYDRSTYLQNLDAVADCNSPDEPDRLAGWYAEGVLKLKGFYFGRTNNQLRCVLLSSHNSAPLAGYAMGNDQLFRFQEDAAGSDEVLTTVCPLAVGDWYDPANGVFSAAYLLPGNADQSRLVTVLAPRSSIEPAGPVGRSCREVSRVRGTLLFEDWKALVAWSRRDDPRMHFYHNLDEMPGYTGVGLPPGVAPPPETIQLDKVIDLADTLALPGGRVEHVPQVRVTTFAPLGIFAAFIPVIHADTVTGPCWVALKLRVLSGRVGFGVFNRHTGLIAKTLDIAAGPDVQTVALRVPDFRAATDIVVFNQSLLVGGQVDVLDASVLVAKPDQKP
jgi:hypothetical protein